MSWIDSFYTTYRRFLQSEKCLFILNLAFSLVFFYSGLEVLIILVFQSLSLSSLMELMRWGRSKQVSSLVKFFMMCSIFTWFFNFFLASCCEQYLSAKFELQICGTAFLALTAFLMSQQSSSSDIIQIFYKQNLSLIASIMMKLIFHANIRIYDSSYFYLLKHQINNYMQEQEGFVKDDKEELIDIHFVPFVPPIKYKQKPYVNLLKLQPQKAHIQDSIFINKQLQEELNNKFISRHRGKIIYSSNAKEAVVASSKVIFQSKFDNGNLQYVVQQDGIYHLYIKPDTNTKSHNQWFYFIVKNMKLKTISMVIHNFVKANMLYKRGLKPYVKSQRSNQLQYQQMSANVVYQQEEEEEKSRYCLSFTYNFQYLFDEVQFSCQPPYSNQRLANLLSSIACKKIQIAKSILGHPINALVINEQQSQAVVVVMARQHPGESVGSWMMEGFIRRVMQVQGNICWIVIPMVNVDGVKLGNNRTGVLGHDFNRSWNVAEESLQEHLFPQIIGIVKYIKKLKREKNKKIKMFIDLHGHSSQPNVFAYGPPHHPQSQYYQNSRLFLCMLSQYNDNFKLNQCSFGISEDKKNCARSVFFSRFGFCYSYTIQSSFGIYKNRNINQLQMVKMGQDICEATNHFIELLLDQQGSRLNQMLQSVKQINIGRSTNSDKDDNSDSDYDEPQRQAFHKRVAYLLKNPKSSESQIPQQKQVIKKDYAASLNMNQMMSMKRQKIKLNRIKTEDVADIKSQRNQYGRKGVLLLPSIKRIHVVKPARKASEQRRAASKNFNLQQVRQKLLNIRHNKTGGKILILNDYPTSFF